MKRRGKQAMKSLWQIAACFANKQTGIKGTPASTEDCLVVKSCGVMQEDASASSSEDGLSDVEEEDKASRHGFADRR